MSLLKYAKRMRKVLSRKDLIVRRQMKTDFKVMGNKDASFAVANDSLNDRSIVYSFGVGTDISFDEGIIDTFGPSVFAFDPTPRSIEWIGGNNSRPDKLIFQPWGISNEDKLEKFYPPVLDAHVSYSIDNLQKTEKGSVEGQVYRLSTIMKKLGHSRLDLLKMDVEGAEYNALDDILGSGIEIRQILVEFHHRFYEGGVARTRDAIRRLNSKGYRIFWVSDSGEEFSFLGK